MNNWLLSLLVGILSILMGILCLKYPFGAAFGVEIFASWTFIILGIVAVCTAIFGNQSNGRVWTAVLGILMAIAGGAMLAYPLVGGVSLAYVFGIFAIGMGIAKFIGGWKINDTSTKWLTILSGVASVILGVLVFMYPVLSLGVLLGCELIFDGIALIAFAFARKRGGVAA